MSKLKISPDLFLESQELEWLRRSLDESGFRRNLNENTIKFGLIKNKANPDFANGLVEADSDVLGGNTIKMRAARGIDTNCQFFTSKAINNIPIPGDNSWYWLKIRHAYSILEEGVFTISTNGDLIDTSGNARLTKIFRGMPNFPTRIKFVNSNYNTLEYDVNEVTDDAHAILQHPATNGSGISAFEGETDLKIQIIGTFTPGIAVPYNSRYIYQYDSAIVELIPETALNTSPATIHTIIGLDDGTTTSTPCFDLARVKSDGTSLVIQDRRTQFWETKGSWMPLEISKAVNPLIAVEAVKFNDYFSPADRNIVEVAWGFRSDNWSVDTANNIVTFNSGLGGKYKTVANFNNYEMNGWRLYFPNGNYSMVTNSIKQGSAINFKLDNLNINDLTNDGYTDFITGTLLVVPDCEEIEICFTPDPSDDHAYITDRFKFPINTPVGRCDVLVYKDDTVFYNLSYRHKSHKEYNDWKIFPSDPIGYYTEASFDVNGDLVATPDIVLYQPVTNPVNGFVQMKLCPWSWYRFRNKIDKGDLIGVNEITTFASITVKNMVVGVDKNYQHIIGNITLTNDIFYDMDLVSSVEGNEFRFHFECTALDLGTKNIYFTQAFGTPAQKILKKITKADVFEMRNQEGGIVIDLKFKDIAGVRNWFMYQNYDLGQTGEIKMFDGIITDFFDGSLDGKVRGYYGWKIYTIMSGRVPMGYGDVTDTDSTVYSFPYGAAGGEVKHGLSVGEMPTHGHRIFGVSGGDGNNAGMDNNTGVTGTDGQPTSYFDTQGGGTKIIEETGGNQRHNNLQPYQVVAFIKKQY